MRVRRRKGAASFGRPRRCRALAPPPAMPPPDRVSGQETARWRAVVDRQDAYITQALAVQGGHLAIGRGGYSLHFKRGANLSGYDTEEMKARCIARGLPVIDTRDVPIDILTVEVIRNPMIAVDEEPDPEPWLCIDKAPLDAMARHYRDLGATVFNVALDDVPAASCEEA